jgi:hypothetical protein
VLRGALQATKANGQPDLPTRVSAARALAALRPDEVEPEPEPEPDSLITIVYDLPPGSSPILHSPPPQPFDPINNTEPLAEPQLEPGTYILDRDGAMILLVRYASDDGTPVHLLPSHQAAAELLRAFGVDTGILDTDSLPNTA